MDRTKVDVVSKIPNDCTNRSTGAGVGIWLVCSSAYLLSLWALLLVPWWLLVPLAIVNGTTISSLFVVGHDACHGSLTASRRLNRWIGTISFLASYHPFSSWAKTHNEMHHAWTGLKGRDPGYAPLSYEEFRQLSPSRRILERFFRSFVGLGIFYFVRVWWKYEVFPCPQDAPRDRWEFRRDRMLVLSFFIFQLISYYVVACFSGRSYPAFFAVFCVCAPQVVFTWLIGFVSLQHHTHPEIPWFDKEEDWSYFQGQVAGIVHLEFPFLTELISLHIFEHTAHHVNPRIPLYHLAEGQRELEIAYPISTKTVRWNLRVLTDTLRCCKLYDYRENRWLDFDAVPTTPAIVLRPVPAPSETRVNAPADCPQNTESPQTTES